MSFIEEHFHSMTFADYPRNYPTWVIGRLQGSKVGFEILDFTLSKLNPFSHNDFADKILSMAKAGRLGSQKAIYMEGRDAYPSDTKVIILTMDMNYMGAGNTRRQYIQQLYELDKLYQEDPRVLPFFHADPRRGNLDSIWKEFLITRNWPGVKIYAPLGYFPDDERLYPIYEHCQETKKPIIAHCTYGNPVHFKGKEKELKILLGDRYDKKLNRKELCNIFTDPRNWIPVIEKYPNLKVCLAHGGGMEQWLEWLNNPSDPNNLLNIIIELIRKYPNNFYLDTSFTLANYNLIPVLQTLMNDPEFSFMQTNICYGSDYYLVISKVSENVIYRNVRTGLGEEKFNQIANINNNKLLYA